MSTCCTFRGMSGFDLSKILSCLMQPGGMNGYQLQQHGPLQGVAVIDQPLARAVFCQSVCWPALIFVSNFMKICFFCFVRIWRGRKRLSKPRRELPDLWKRTTQDLLQGGVGCFFRRGFEITSATG